MKRILYLYFGATSPVTLLEHELIKSINSKRKDLKIDFWDWTSELGLTINPSINWAYRNQNYLQSFYKKFLSLSHDYDFIFIAQTGGIIPEILCKIKSKVIFNTADDPESSKSCSFPFVDSVKMIVHAGIGYDKTKTVGDILKEKGAPEVYFMPIGFYEQMFPKLSNFDESFDKRTIPLVFVGVPKIGKLEKIINHFKESFFIYCRKTSGKYNKIYYRIITGRNIPQYNGPLLELYRNTQVGINIHYSYGPSNVRTYQLCAAGIAQVLDCPDWNHKLFTPNEEIMSYSSQKEAIESINMLLSDKDLRYKISINGYRKTHSEYNREYLLNNLFNYLIK